MMNGWGLAHNQGPLIGGCFYSWLTAARFVSLAEPRAPEVTDLYVTGGEIEAQTHPLSQVPLLGGARVGGRSCHPGTGEAKWPKYGPGVVSEVLGVSSGVGLGHSGAPPSAPGRNDVTRSLGSAGLNKRPSQTFSHAVCPSVRITSG